MLSPAFLNAAAGSAPFLRRHVCELGRQGRSAACRRRRARGRVRGAALTDIATSTILAVRCAARLAPYPNAPRPSPSGCPARARAAAPFAGQQ